MKITHLLFLCVFLMSAGSAGAADDFGDRFMQTSPAALEDAQESFPEEIMPYDIEPAAGDEEQDGEFSTDQLYEIPVDEAEENAGQKFVTEGGAAHNKVPSQ